MPLPRTVHETYQEKVVLVWYGTFVEDDEELVDGILLGSISQDIGLMTAASDAIEMLLVPAWEDNSRETIQIRNECTSTVQYIVSHLKEDMVFLNGALNKFRLVN